MTPSADHLKWPDRRNCDWDCPWPSYCLECHAIASAAMNTARRNIVEFIARRPLELIP